MELALVHRGSQAGFDLRERCRRHGRPGFAFEKPALLNRFLMHPCAIAQGRLSLYRKIGAGKTMPRPVRTMLFPAMTMDAPLRILAVDNEPSVTLSLRFVFAGPRYEVTCVESGVAALARLDNDSNRYDVMIVDQKMPHLTGAELVSVLRERGNNGKVIVVSAHLSSEIREAYKRMDVHEMFSKPFNVGELRSAVDRLAA
jgi:CheY-like chemotaxis protein